jgi:hypothetical protein
MTTVQDYNLAKRVLMQYVGALLETIKESGAQGAPLGPMYMAFQTVGMGYDTFMQIIDALEDAGQIRRTSEVAYFIGDLRV